MLLSPAAAAAGGVWGPGIRFIDGVVCHGPDARTALVSWPGPSGPAFAIGGISGPAAGRRGPTTVPAVGGSSSPLPDGAAGLSSAQAGAIAYLIQHYGHARSNVIADVAAGIVGQVNGNVYVTDCLNSHAGGMSPDVAAQLWNEAVNKAGPYRVEVTGPADGATPGRATPIAAHVTTASGAAATGIAVHFDATAGSLSAANAATDSSGRTQVDITSAGSTTVTASISAVTGLVQTTGGSAVPLVSAAAPAIQSGRLKLRSAATADPVLSVAADQPVQPEASTLRSTLRVTGMRGHRGTATVSAYGPLAYSARAGCKGHTAAEWNIRRAGRAVGSGRAKLAGDGSYNVTAAVPAKSGCYQLAASVTTGNATPNVTRTAVGSVVTVAPIAITATPIGHGLATSGPLTTTLDIHSRDGSALREVAAQLVGPRRPSGSRCPSTGWARTGAAAAAVTVSDESLHSGRVSKVGCYGFRITGRLTVPGSGAGTVNINPGRANPPVLVIDPSVTLAGLSATHVDAGGTVQGTVTISGSQKQAGTLRLQLLRKPYTSRGCIGLDWDDAIAIPTDSPSPTTSVHGDGTYRVRSPDVASTACWTVVPVFTARANTAVQVTGVAGRDPTLAFVSIQRAVKPAARDQPRAESSNGSRVVLTSALTAGLLVLALGVIVALARRSRNSSD